MRTLMKTWNPWQDFDQIHREMSRLFGRPNTAEKRIAAYPPVNLWADDAMLVLTAEIPGIDPEQLDVTVNRNTITLSGKREFHEAKEGETFFRRERSAESFSRTLELPFDVDPQSADATYEKGVLRLELTRPASHQPKKVDVKAG